MGNVKTCSKCGNVFVPYSGEFTIAVIDSMEINGAFDGKEKLDCMMCIMISACVASGLFGKLTEAHEHPPDDFSQAGMDG